MDTLLANEINVRQVGNQLEVRVSLQRQTGQNEENLDLSVVLLLERELTLEQIREASFRRAIEILQEALK